ncbi:MAG: glycerophosphodiester phosphodiesterase [Alphaproteobacteria bacterium]
MSLSRPLPKVIGHRGAAARAPENTLAGLRTAAALGAGMVEFDTKLTGDGVPILLHDSLVDRTTDGSGPVRDMGLAAVRALDAGAWFGPGFAGEPVPTLAQALSLALRLGLAVNIEIKPCDGREVETAEAALAVAAQVWPADRPAPLVSSYSREALRAVRRIRPDWPRGLLFGTPPADWMAQVDDLAPATINVSQRRLTADRVARLRAAGRPVLAYTVNDPARARALFDIGVAAVFTDAPDTILAGLGDGV